MKKLQNCMPIFTCEKCNYNTVRKSSWEKHIKTEKHNCNIFNTIEKGASKSFTCTECNKTYKDPSGLWHHKKVCIEIKQPLDSTNDVSKISALFIDTMKQNQEFQKQIFEFMKDNIGTTNNHSNNTTTNNTKFNLNFFLNETCKDAMNLSDFVSSLQLTMSDLENVGKLGYTEGISRIFTNGLKKLDITKRPIHCSDLKRETVYVKNENKWEKESDHLKKAIKQITNKNIKLIPKWKEENPDHNKYNNRRNDEYLKIMYESMGPTDAEEESKSFGKIITNLAKETFIVKSVGII